MSDPYLALIADLTSRLRSAEDRIAALEQSRDVAQQAFVAFAERSAAASESRTDKVVTAIAASTAADNATRDALTELRHALERKEFAVYFQPITQAAGKGVVGMEALVRWNNATRGMVSPAHFIPLAEETGLILPLGQWVLEVACTQLVAWSARAATRGTPPPDAPRTRPGARRRSRR